MKVLELIFLTGEGKTTRMSIDNPIEPVDLEQVKTAMGVIIASDTFIDQEGNGYEEIKGARLVERTITEFDLN